MGRFIYTRERERDHFVPLDLKSQWQRPVQCVYHGDVVSIGLILAVYCMKDNKIICTRDIEHDNSSKPKQTIA